jgi:hypothetical protein
VVFVRRRLSTMSQAKKKNFKIEPFKHKVEMDPKYAEKTWKILEDAIHEIYNHNASGLSFEELYRYEKRERERDRLYFFCNQVGILADSTPLFLLACATCFSAAAVLDWT